MSDRLAQLALGGFSIIGVITLYATGHLDGGALTALVAIEFIGAVGIGCAGS